MTVRIGILGAAGIAPEALIAPSHAVDGAEVVAVAARDRATAENYAREHGIPRVLDSYDALLADPDIDLIYNPTPNGLHGRWTIAAVRAGKHVLAEKPFTANGDEAREVATIVDTTPGIVFEAFHYRYHPMMVRAIEIVRSGEIGELVSVESEFSVPGRPHDDIRWSLPLAGGSLMDLGCYPTHLVRSIVGAEPKVTSATAVEGEPGVDGEITTELEFPGGVIGRVRSSMVAASPTVFATITGTAGVIELANPFQPHLGGSSITVRAGETQRVEEVTSEPSYNFQLRAVVDAITSGGPVLTNTVDAVANMDVIDAAYRAAGMSPRQPTN
jgi:predicted dehydrogenase